MSQYQSYMTINLQFAGDGTTVNTAYPQALLLDTFSYSQPLALMGFLMSSAVRTESGLNTGIWLVVGNSAATIGISQGANILGSCLSNTNSSAANNFYNPASVSTPVFYPPGFGIKLPTNTPISLYGAAANAATDYLACATTLYFILIK